MKKGLALSLCSVLLFGGVASAHGTSPHAGSNKATTSTTTTSKGNTKGTLTVLVNGVKVVSKANEQVKNGKVYVSVKAFADVFGKNFEISKDSKSVQFNGKIITDVRMNQGEITAYVRDLAIAVSAQNLSWDGSNKEVYILALPAGTIQLEPGVVPAMGEHWANPKAGELPKGPIYGVYKGKLVFLEYMIAQDDFIKGVNHVNLNGMKGVPSPAVVQTDIEFQPKGHPGFEIPHFDVHMYFISDEEQQAIK